MSVPIIENWTVVTGVAHKIQPTPARKGFAVVTVSVEKAEPVEGFANLLGHAAGQQLEILIPIDLAEQLNLTVGDTIIARVRRGPDRLNFVHQQHVSAEHTQQ